MEQQTGSKSEKEYVKAVYCHPAYLTYQLNGHEFGKTPGVGDGQGGLACCDSWGRKDSDTTERLN